MIYLHTYTHAYINFPLLIYSPLKKKFFNLSQTFPFKFDRANSIFWHH